MNISDAKKLEGNYEIHPSNAENRWYHNAYIILNEFQPKERYDLNKIQSFEIKILNENTLNITYENSNLVTNYNYKIEKNGFIRLTNKSKVRGIPYLFGGIQMKKIELGRTKTEQLIINGVEIDESAILFIPISLPKENFTYIFEKKIKKEHRTTWVLQDAGLKEIPENL